MFSGPRFSVSVLSYVLVLCSYIVDHEMGGGILISDEQLSSDCSKHFTV